MAGGLLLVSADEECLITGNDALKQRFVSMGRGSKRFFAGKAEPLGLRLKWFTLGVLIRLDVWVFVSRAVF